MNRILFSFPCWVFLHSKSPLTFVRASSLLTADLERNEALKRIHAQQQRILRGDPSIFNSRYKLNNRFGHHTDPSLASPFSNAEEQQQQQNKHKELEVARRLETLMKLRHQIEEEQQEAPASIFRRAMRSPFGEQGPTITIRRVFMDSGDDDDEFHGQHGHSVAAPGLGGIFSALIREKAEQEGHSPDFGAAMLHRIAASRIAGGGSPMADNDDGIVFRRTIIFSNSDDKSSDESSTTNNTPKIEEINDHESTTKSEPDAAKMVWKNNAK